MTERRCPNCGGLVGADAEWCGQCFAPLEGGEAASAPTAKVAEPARATETALPKSEAATERPSPGHVRRPAGTSPGVFKASEDGLRWVCPTCGSENDLEASACESCGTEFRALFEKPEPVPRGNAPAAAGRSLLFPGLGYGALGRKVEGVARGVTFLWMAGMAIAFVIIRRGLGLGPFLPLVLLLGVGAAAVYVLSAIDARRFAAGASPLLSTRGLLLGSAGMMGATVVLILIIAIRARQGG